MSILTVKIHSKKIQKAAQGKMCTLRLPGICSGNPKETVLAHLNTSWKGWGNKSPDIFAVLACRCCHDVLDGRVRVPGLDLPPEILRALMETQGIFLEEELIIIK